MQLVDSDRFVSTFAPLAEDPAVQELIVTQVSAAIEQNLDIDALVGDVFDGIRGLELPPRADTALTLLQGPAADGIRSLIGTVTEQVVQSPQFADIWEQALRVTHERAVAVIQGDPNAVVSIGADGTLAVELGTVIEAVKSALVERGVSFAEAIPVIDRAIPLMQSDALLLVQSLYNVAVAVGFWLPWVVLALLVGGVMLARDRRRSSVTVGFGVAAVFLLLAAGLAAARMLFIGALSPSVMSTEAADVVFGSVTDVLTGSAVALVVVGALVALVSWYRGTSRYAQNLRAVLEGGAVRVRDAADRNGLSTGAFGRGVERWRPVILFVSVVLALAWIFLSRPITLGVVVGALVSLLAVVLVVELVRRPAIEADIPQS